MVCVDRQVDRNDVAPKHVMNPTKPRMGAHSMPLIIGNLLSGR
jgi:hypothetical protein